MDSRIIAFAVPGFFLLILVEMLVARLRKARLYRLHDSIASMSCGIGEQVIVVFTVGLSFLGYRWVSRHAALLHVPEASVLAWVALFFLVDHSYYWFHRASHRVSFLWAGHAVHHQSEEYNLSTALRQNWIENLLAWPFYLPLAVLGFPLGMYVTASTVNTIYQFWIHTRLIRKLGPAEGVMNTPSSHRVHHGVDPKYVDRNYGGMFMLWDRLYGTYQPEEEEPIYGTVKPLASFSPLWANVEGWSRMARMASETSGWRDKAKVWFAPPDWRPADLGGPVVVPEVDRAAYEKFDVPAPRAVNRYVLVQFGIVSALTGVMMATAQPRPGVTPIIPESMLVPWVLWVLVALTAWAALVEGRKWAVPIELLRQAAGIGLALVEPVAFVAAAVASAAVSVALLERSWRAYTPPEQLHAPLTQEH